MSGPTWEQCFTLLGLEQPEVFAEKVMASPDHVALLAAVPDHERHRYVYAQTGRTTSQLVWVAWRVSQGQRAMVWVLPYGVQETKRKLSAMVQALGGDMRSVRIMGRKPEYRDVVGAENLVLSMDHAVQDVWDRRVLELARSKGWQVG